MKLPLRIELETFLIWWAEGLALALPRSWRERCSTVRRYLLVRELGEEVVFESIESKQNEPAARMSVPAIGDWDRAALLTWLHEHELTGGPVIVRTATNRVLEKRVRYPAAKETDLYNIISFDIERQTPFSRNDVYFGYVRRDDPQSGGHTDLDLIVLPKRDIEELLRKVRTLDLEPAVLDVDGRDFFEHAVNLLSQQSDPLNLRPNYALRFALLFLWLGLIGLVPVKQAYDTNHVAEKLERQERKALAEVRALNDLRDEYNRLREKRMFFRNLVREHTSSLQLLNELTETLDDETWIQRFDFKNDRVTLQGESSNASDLPSVIGASNQFSAPRFSSPVTRNNASGLDRFQLTVQVETGGPT